MRAKRPDMHGTRHHAPPCACAVSGQIPSLSPSHTEWKPALPRRRVLDRVDAVVLSHADLGHLGALTYLVARWGGPMRMRRWTRQGTEGGQ